MDLRKPTKIRSKKIRQSAKGESCTLRLTNCSSNETVVFCHAPSKYKGMGTKSDDFWGAYGCSNCHAIADGMPESYCNRWMSAIFETQKRLIEKGLITVK